MKQNRLNIVSSSTYYISLIWKFFLEYPKGLSIFILIKIEK